MTDLAIITPSYAPDYELCRDLHRSVLEYTAASVVHYVIAPERDRELFSTLQSPRCVLWSESDLLRPRLLPVPRTNSWLSLRRPFPPVRGWVIQQIVKLAAAGRVEADVLLLVDSDVLFVRPVAAEQFVRDGSVRFYRKDSAVSERMPRHVTWHQIARKLLGLPRAWPPLPDYISSFSAWDPRVVLGLHERIQEVTGRHWVDAIASQLHFSEWTLYGVFVDEVLGEPANAFATDTMLCHSYWDTVPLDSEAATAFVRDASVQDVAVMISAKSHTALDVRRAALASIRAE